MITLRDYQTRDLARIRAAYQAGFRRVCYQLPTGGGKTIVFAHIVQVAAARGKRVLILTHRRELVRQTVARVGVPVGIIAAGLDSERDRPVQVAMIQTMVRRLEQYAEPDLVIVDETHHATAETWEKVIGRYQTASVLGVTATPCRMDGRGLGHLYDTLICGPSVADLTAAGFLCPARVYAPAMIDLDGVAVKRGDYDVAELEGRASVITGDAVAQYRRLTVPGVPAVAFCVSVAHAQSVAEAFRAAGYRSEAVYGDMDQHDRDRILSGLGTGRQDVVTACDLISEGLDIPEIGAGIMLRPTRSLALAIQQVGRCLRPATGKEAAIILDHAGNCLRHGLPDEPREWSLDGAKRRKRASEDPPCRRCDQCYGVHHPAATCPFCGYVYPPKPRTVKQQAGELTLMERTVRRQQVGRCRTIEELKRVANERGYAAGWVWRMARVKGIRV